MLQEAALAARQLEEDTQRRCQQMEKDAKEKAEAYWAEVSVRLEKFYEDHSQLKELLAAGGKS